MLFENNVVYMSKNINFGVLCCVFPWDFCFWALGSTPRSILEALTGIFTSKHSSILLVYHVVGLNHQNHQNPWKSIKHGSTGSPKQVPKTASIECCARPLVPQVMKVCFILVLGHRYETCTLVFYRGVFKKKTVAQSALMPLYRENGVKKNLCTPIL